MNSFSHLVTSCFSIKTFKLLILAKLLMSTSLELENREVRLR